MNHDREWLALELAKMKEREVYLIANRPIEKVLRFHVEQLQSTDEKLVFLTEVFCLTEELREEIRILSESNPIKPKRRNLKTKVLRDSLIQNSSSDSDWTKASEGHPCRECEGSGVIIDSFPGVEDPYNRCQSCKGTGLKGHQRENTI